ncbi:hypothetical protein F383_00772 [Gossypium arboreum]|uniref:Uncharacterized protein n=1 Tax=Gossypium arboreum TaxID=29729 RepID=A0A0B0PQR8_GOSAR|nr:hypothetical protein F383_00772 [Gossypium arboreum]
MPLGLNPGLVTCTNAFGLSPDLLTRTNAFGS